jgi:hypothetical protein
MRSILYAIPLALSLVAASGCKHTMPPDVAMAELKNPNPQVRRDAADALRTKDGVPANAVPVLLDALKNERDPAVQGAILITLGKSGSPEAKPPIEAAVQGATGKDMRRWAGRALKLWMQQTGALPQDYKFPEGWPYGQPGYPPPEPK